MAEEELHQSRSAPEEPSFPYVRYGVPAGVLGALVVALFFLILDLVDGRPFATPNALGRALFLREPVDLAAPLSAPVIVGYTALHGTIFLGFGLVAAVIASGTHRASAGLASAGIALGLFLATEATFFCLGFLTAGSLSDELGGLQIALANLLAAGVMSIPLSRLYAREEVDDDLATVSGQREKRSASR